jgi:hypothetical protein
VLGSDLTKNNNRVQVIFSKDVKKGEAFKLRSNANDPPYPILLEPKKSPSTGPANPKP